MKAQDSIFIDPDDSISEELYKMQGTLRDRVNLLQKRLQEIPASEPVFGDLCKILSDLGNIHAAMWHIINFIHEYDADKSPVHGPYSNVFDLFEALDSKL